MRWFHVEPSGVDPCAYVQGLYTEAEVDDLINILGYIPVADLNEYQDARITGSRLMGGCTIWAGTYTTGRDKKYIQIKPFDGSSVANLTPLGSVLTAPLTGIYDGNGFVNININVDNTSGQGQGAFIGAISNAEVRNVIIHNSTFRVNQGSNINRAAAIASSSTGASIIENCTVNNCTIIKGVNNFVGQIGGCVGNAEGTTTITNCSVSNITLTNQTNSATAVTNGVGGFIGALANGCSVINCHVDGVNITEQTACTGGFVGRNGRA